MQYCVGFCHNKCIILTSNHSKFAVFKLDFRNEDDSFNLRLYIYMEKAMAPHSSPLAWKIPWTEEPGRLQSMGSRRVGHD